MNKKKYILAGAAIIAAIIWSGVFLNVRSSVSQLNGVAQEIIGRCAHGNRDAHAACYEGIIPALYPRFTVEQIAEMVRFILVSDPSYKYCHTLGHKIGERVVDEDPANWVRDIHLDPSGTLCEGGYLHGVLAERFKSDVLSASEITASIPDFKRACSPSSAWTPTPFEQMQCFHGMGHLYMYASDFDIPTSITLCNETIPADDREGPRPCYSAVFMQVFQATPEEEQSLLKHLPFKPDTMPKIKTFCATFSDPVVHGTCLSRSAPLFPDLWEDIGADTFCSGEVNALEKRYCYARVYLKSTYQMLYYNKAADSPCLNVGPEHREACYAMTAITVLRQDLPKDIPDAINFCTNSTPTDLRDSCMTALASDSAYSFKKGTPEFNAYCKLFSGSAQQVCLHYEKTEYLDIGLGDNVE